MIPLCILAIEDDDDRAFMEALFENYNRLMYYEIIKIVRDPWVTEDLMQTTLVKLIEKVQDLKTKERNQLVNYIISACKNRALNYLRDNAKKHTSSLDELWNSPDSAKDGKRIEEQLIRQADVDALSRIWPKLDDRCRFVLEWRYFLDRSPAEIARELNIKPESVRMALTRARKSAYQLLMEDMKNPQ